MKKRFVALSLALLSLTLGVALLPKGVSATSNPVNPEVGDDPITYSTGSVADLTRPHFADASEEEEETLPVDIVKIHYVNDDGACKGRAFYVWVNGVDGQEYSDASNDGKDQDIVEYSADGTSMCITINIKKDAPDTRFKEFVGRREVMYIVKYKMISPSNLNWGGQSDDVECNFEVFEPVNGVVEVWSTPAAGGGMAQFKTEAETKVDGIKLAQFSDWKTIHCVTTSECKNVSWKLYAYDENYYKVKLKKRGDIQKNYLVASGSAELKGDYKEFDIDFNYTAKINVVYSIVSKEKSSTSKLEKTVFVSPEKLYETPKFDTYYTYSGNDLGCSWNEEFTTFKVWSPIAANMSVLLYDTDTTATYGGNDKSIGGWHMSYAEGGIWTLTIMGNLENLYYNYQVDTYNGSTTTMDPYATTAGRSGLRAMIYDKSKTNPDGWNDLPLVWDGVEGYDIKTPQELSIYEVHVKDFTGDSSWVSKKGNKNGTYKAFVESGTRLAIDDSITTGFDHLDELGVKAVQLLPVFDADNDESEKGCLKYNWGYNPQNYNCVEGSYSSDPSDGRVRVKEFKELVLGMSKTKVHTRVIMDVVYNHVSSASSHAFNKLMPRYFFRYDEKGELYDGSGCHNEVKSEATMCRKYIIDSVCMWAKEYKIKGFRFDLMGLLDYQTMNLLREKLYQIDPDIYVYGEGWTSGGYHGSTLNNGTASTYEVYKYCNNFNPITGDEDKEACFLGAFNDTGRNAVKGANNQWGATEVYPQCGFLQEDGDPSDRANCIADMVWGIHRGKSNYAKQTINYVSCHDNWTVRDQLYQTLGHDGHGAEPSLIIHGSIAAHTLVMASNSAAFMLGGEELFRTKEVPQGYVDSKDVLPATFTKLYGHNISHNSYNSPLDVNSFKWGNKFKIEYDGATALNSEYHYNEAFASAVQLHDKIYAENTRINHSAPTNKYKAWPNGVTSTGEPYINLFWNGGEGNAWTIGIQYDELFIFVSGKSGGNISAGTAESPIASDLNHVFHYGYQKDNSGILNCGGLSVGVYCRGGLLK